MSKLVSMNKLCPVCKLGELAHIREPGEEIRMLGSKEPHKITEHKIKCKSCKREWDTFEIIFDKDWNIKMITLED